MHSDSKPDERGASDATELSQVSELPGLSTQTEARVWRIVGWIITFYKWWFLFVGSSVALLGILILLQLAILGTDSFGPSTAARQANCKGNLQQIGLALHNYLSTNGAFPPAYTVDADGRKMHSWRALLLPYFEAGSVDPAIDYDFDQPWDSLHNQQFANRMPSVYWCPSDRTQAKGGPARSNYVAVVGLRTFWPGDRGRTRMEFTDGLSNTIAVVEATDDNISWLEPRDLAFDELTLRLNDADGQGPSSKHPAQLNVLMADGSALALPNAYSPAKLRALLTVDGDEKVNPREP